MVLQIIKSLIKLMGLIAVVYILLLSMDFGRNFALYIYAEMQEKSNDEVES